MAKSRENIALEWTRAELVETLGSARRTLETYAEGLDADAATANGRASDAASSERAGSDGTRKATELASCVDALHQAHGVLVMLELEAAATFAAHLESVALGLTEGTLAEPAAAAERLMQGLLELPDYLDAQRAGLGDTIVPLLPVLNELRVHLRQPPLAAPHQAPAFAAVPEAAVLERFTTLDGLEKVRRLRGVYQQVLLSVLKGGIDVASVETLQKVALSMQRLCEGTPTAVLWRAFDEYLHPVRETVGLARGAAASGALGADTIKLLRRLDSELRGVAQGGIEALARPVPAELLQQLVGPTLDHGRSNAFLEGLQQALSASDISEALASSGRRALATAAAALRDDLTSVRDRVDLLVRRGSEDSGNPVELDALLAPLKQISSTMSLLGLESSRALVAGQIDVLAGAAVDATALATMADALEQVDRNLASLSHGGKGDAELVLDAAQQAVLTEARHGLELLKQGIVDYVSSHWDARHLQELPGALNGVASALRMVPLPEAAVLLDRCVAYLTEELLAGHVPDWRELDRYAGAVSGVDYYLERLATPGGAGADEILAYAQRSLAELDGAPQPVSASDSAEALDEAAVDAGGDTVEPATEATAAEAAMADAAEAATAAESRNAVEEAAEAAAEEEWSLADDIELVSAADAPTHATAVLPGEEQAPHTALALPAPEPFASTAAPFWKVPEVPADVRTTAVIPVEETQPEPEAEEILLEAPAAGWSEPDATLAEVAATLDHEQPERSLEEFLDEPFHIPGNETTNEIVDEIFDEPIEEPAEEPYEELVAEPVAEWTEEIVAGPVSETVEESVRELAVEVVAEADEKRVDAPADAVAREPVVSSASAAVLALLAEHADQFDVDEEILEVFVEEVDEVLAAIDTHLPPWQRDLGEGQHAMELRRAFHTLKGSGRLVGANVLGELGWSIEQMLNRVIDGSIDASAELLQVIAAARSVTPALRDAFAARVAGDRLAVARVIERAELLAAGVELATADDTSGLVTTNAIIAAQVADSAGTAASEPDDRGAWAEEPEPQSIFCEEAEEHLATIASARQGDGYRVDEPVTRAFHTLAGSAAMVGVPAVAELARATLDLLQAVLESREAVVADGEVAALLEAVHAAVEADVRALRAGHGLLPHSDLIEAAERLRDAAPVAPLVSALLALPGLDALLNAQDYLADWRMRRFDTDRAWTLNTVLRELVDLSQAPEHAALADIANALRDAHDRLARTRLGEAAERVLLAGHERLLGQIDALVAGQPLRAVDESIAALRGLDPATEATAAIEAPADDVLPLESAADAPASPEVREPEPGPPQADEPALVVEAVDPELLEIFLEEAEELLEQMDHAVRACTEHADPQTAIEGLLRALHTLKGGARLAGLARAGNAAHDFESWLIGHRDVGAALDSTAATELHARYDGLAALIANAGRASHAPPVAERARQAEEAHVPEQVDSQVLPAEAAAPQDDELELPVRALEQRDLVPEPDRSAQPAAPARTTWFVPDIPVAPAAAAGAGSNAAPPAQRDQRGNEEVVRVRASLLEQLVGLAGEASIIRGRVQQGLTEFGGALDEMETTIQRLREQLRRLEIETETQILFRRERPDAPGNEDFDPLELDRYSQLQQLSRSLSESASDMLDLKETLRLRAGETDALLVQQGRINTQLQEGLMRSRMVPFARLVPRLRRTVRQVAQDLGKPVDLVAYNVEGELDRSLLDRMMAPLEHMLRNAVDHGIESPDVRRALGKSATGQIELRLSREGGDVVIEISDDGAGIDVARVKAKAEEQGLLALNAELSDDEIRQFIFAPGFSTARSVTQISGRGVGMDVAYSEVKQLGGSIGLASEPGRGTRFQVRVPFTVSVNRALMVSVGEDLYAVPLNTIEGIVLVRGDELAALAGPEGGLFEYAGLGYRVRHLAEYLGRRARPGGTAGSVPVVLVRSGDSAVAVQVDGVQGSREIVVKGLGPQFAGVAGISGATILGDGGVVVILDLPALVRGRLESGSAERKRGGSLARSRAILVVDDSVTVRKVTSRLLERNGMEAMLAKDGVEAIASLQERRPDVMLLDIEMPRMDGFEVLRHVRHDPRLSDLPVIMISSRTGAKHQDRAAELGVSHFLGKPFQEAELLTVIEELLE
jgi:chemosensory pili system protein ChpA (sensor histidine kinase/response regulator)